MPEKKDERGFYARLIDAMAEMENPTKSKQAYKYKYETLEQVLGIIRPALVKNGLMVTQLIKHNPPAEPNGKIYWVLETVVFDRNGETKIVDERPIPICDDAQKQGSWETYLRRYALRTAFGLTGEDDDGAATLPAKNQNGGAYANIKGAKVTEMASEQQIKMIHAKLDELAKLRGVSKDEAESGLFNFKDFKGHTYDTLTKSLAHDAIDQLILWIDKAQPAELYDEDQEF